MSQFPESPEFEKLRVLLSLKRSEQPPPGYFSRFSSLVIAEIAAEASAEPEGWWQRFLARFDAKPVLACAYSVAIGGLLVVGMGLSQVLGREQATHLPGQGSWLATIPSPVSGHVVDPSILETEPVFPPAYHQAQSSSMEPVWNSEAPSFLVGGAGRLVDGVGAKIERAGFRLQGR